MNSQHVVRQDLYSVLGVANDCAQDDIKRAYRTLARRHHPDANSGAVPSEQRFKTISAAYTVLSNPLERAQYDALRGTRHPRRAGSARPAATDPGSRAGSRPTTSSSYSRASSWPMGTSTWGQLPMVYWAATWGWTRRSGHP